MGSLDRVTEPFALRRCLTLQRAGVMYSQAIVNPLTTVDQLTLEASEKWVSSAPLGQAMGVEDREVDPGTLGDHAPMSDVSQGCVAVESGGKGLARGAPEISPSPFYFLRVYV